MSKDPCRPHTGNTQWSMWACLLTWDCLSHYNFHNVAYKKVLNHVKWGVELKMNWLNWSIPISSGFQFQFKIFQFNSNSIHAELNWIDYQFQFNSWIDPSPVEEVPYCFSRSSVKFQGHPGQKIADFDPNRVFPDCNSSLNLPTATKWSTKLEVA